SAGRRHRGSASRRPAGRAAAGDLAGRLFGRRSAGALVVRVSPRRRIRVHRAAARPRKEVVVIRGVGKSMRLKRVIDQAGVSVICALDHGMTSPQFLEPLADIATRTAEAVAGGANVIMMSMGIIRVAELAFAPETSLALLQSALAN